MTTHRNLANPALAAAMRGIRRSGACTPHGDGRTKRARTRAAAKSRSIREAS